MATLSMPIGKVAADIAQVWGFPDFASVPAFGQERIRIEINAAIQQMQDAGEDFYGREDILVELIEDQEFYVLDESVQTVLEPVSFEDGNPLTKLTTRGQILQYGQVFRDQLSGSMNSGRPESYFVHSERVDAADNVRTKLQFLPAPSASIAAGTSRMVVVPVIKEASLFLAAELTAGTASLPVPHKYVESIFLPLARFNATSCYLFYKQDSMPKYTSDYERALRLLGQANPHQPQPPDSNTAALETPAARPAPQ